MRGGRGGCTSTYAGNVQQGSMPLWALFAAHTAKRADVRAMICAPTPERDRAKAQWRSKTVITGALPH